MKRILYVGNNLTKKTKYYSSMELLCCQLEKEGYHIRVSSNKVNKIRRVLDMSWAVIKNRNWVDYILIDTFSTSNFYFAFVVSQLSRLFKIKYIPILRGGNLPNRLDLSQGMSSKIFLNSFINVAPSNYLKNEFEKREYKVIHIPNIIEVNSYKFKKRTLINPYLLFVRAFDRTYNPLMAIHVLKNVKMKFPTAKLCMIGPAKDDTFEEAKKLTSELNLTGDIEFTGVLTKKEWHEKSQDFDIFINTTNFDNTPVSVMESMALGLPVVSTNVGGLPYLIDHEIDGILVGKNDVEDMSNQIGELLKGPKKVERIVHNARMKVEQFDWSIVKSKWNEILMV